MNKTSKLLLKFVGLVVSYIAFSWLIPQCDTVTDEWFNAWLWATVCSIALIIFFGVWICETLISWNNEQHKENQQSAS